MDFSSKIGVFDSGLGGISVLHTIHDLMPKEDLIYFGDSLHNPYGTKSKEEITERCIEICDFFMAQDVKAIVIACNTATSACVNLLRDKYPIDIIGMEPALKVACEKGEHQKIAVWATNLTLKEKKFARLMERFEDEHTIYKIPCPKLVELVETEKLQNTDLVYAALHEYLHQTQGEEIDSIVLGCTHFVFYKELLQDMLPSSIQLIDGNYGTAHHLKDILTHKNLLNDSTGTIEWHNTDADKINLSKRLLKQLEGTL